MLITIIILVLSAVFFVNGKVRSDIVALCALIALLGLTRNFLGVTICSFL